MSNISLYTTPKLSNDTLFINSFLDELIESYFGKRLEPNTSVSLDFNYPDLFDLIKDHYPMYYHKSGGLFANKVTTQVVVLFEDDLLTLLDEALSHKLSRLFINIGSATPSLRLVPKSVHSYDTLFHDYIDFFKNNLHRRSTFKIPDNVINTLFTISNFKIIIEKSDTFVYKPDVASINGSSDNSKLFNEQVFTEIGYFNDQTQTSLVYSIALDISNSTFNSYANLLTEEFYSKLKNKANEILSRIYRRVDRLKDEYIQVEREEKLRKEHANKVRQQEFDRISEQSAKNLLLKENIEEQKRYEIQLEKTRELRRKAAKELYESQSESVSYTEVKDLSSITLDVRLIRILVSVIALFIVGCFVYLIG